MRIDIAHFYLPGTDGRRIQCIVFGADSLNHNDAARRALLTSLTLKARVRYNLAVDKSALMFEQFGEVRFFGTPDLVEYLSNNGVPSWTHEIEA